MKDEKTMYPYFPEWMPMGDSCYDIAADGTLTEKGEYDG